MKTYHKIQTVFLRDPETKFKTLLEGEYAKPEFAYLAENRWDWTEKVDGTNIRVMIRDDVQFGGKTDRAQIPAQLVSALNAMFLPQTPELLEMFPDGACLYGEGYGAKIQKGGGNYRPDQSFVLFDVRVGDWWLERDGVEKVADDLGLDAVPIIGSGTLPELVSAVRDGFYSEWGKFDAEGIVARPSCGLVARNGQRIITKLKCKDFR